MDTGYKFYSDYGPGDVVVLKVDEDMNTGMITEVIFAAGGFIKYFITWPSGDSTSHYGIELEMALKKAD